MEETPNYNYDNGIPINVDEIFVNQLSSTKGDSTKYQNNELDLDKLQQEKNEELVKVGNIEEKGEIDLKVQYEKIKRKIEKRDFKSRIYFRSMLIYFTCGLLIVQNVATYYLVFKAFIEDNLSDLSLIISVLATATLIETGFLMKAIYKLIFKEINYNLNDKKKSEN